MESRRFVLLPLLLVMLSCFAPAASAALLPELAGFQAEKETVFPLNSAAGPVGEWTTRTYRGENGNSVKVTLLTGSGPGSFTPSDSGGKKDDRPLGFGSTYEVIPLGGRMAVLEEIPSVGIALAVPLEKEGSLTLESPSLPREEILAAALELLGKMSGRK